ncbi:MAG: protein-glutamate methylesterase/protein-glutamine glutaminase [Nanobdellota archaeon]
MIKALVVDDSALMRKLITDMISSDDEIDVVDTAKDGDDALEKVKKHGPDIVLMDLEMPGKDGITALEEIMEEWPLPVIMLTGDSDNNKAFDAMKAGAVDFITKPSNVDSVKDKVIKQIKSLAMARVHKFDETPEKKSYSFAPSSEKIILIGASTGGPQTLEKLLQEFPANTPSPILIVQHMPPLFTRSFAERLNSACDLEVKEAEHGDRLKNGLALLAPGGYHMEIDPEDPDKVVLNKKPPELGVRPNVNRLFNSAAPVYKDKTIALVLTGMGQDGTSGSRKIKRYGGTVVSEAEESCIIYGMPKSVAEEGLADEVVPLDQMTVAVVQLLDI